jgi:hypothetical protein
MILVPIILRSDLICPGRGVGRGVGSMFGDAPELDYTIEEDWEVLEEKEYDRNVVDPIVAYSCQVEL